MFRTAIARRSVVRPGCLARYSTRLTPPTEDASPDSATKSSSSSLDPEPTNPSSSDSSSSSTPSSSSTSPPESSSSPPPSSSSSSSQSSENAPSGDYIFTKEYLRELTEQKAIALRHQTDHLTQSLSATFSQLGGRINKVTGYDEIDALKKGVVEQEARITAARTAAREAKLAYEAAVEQRSNSQREVNDLLQRKSSWKTPELTRFMELIQEEHVREQEEARSKNAVRQTEEEVEKEFNDLLRLILARYHEEQVWSDKIRSVSTYGSMAVLGVNVFVFLLAIILVEPWKRKRLAQTFEKKVEELALVNSQAVENGIGALRERLDVQEQMLSQLVAAATTLQSERESIPSVSTEPPDEVEQGPVPLTEQVRLASILGYVTSGALLGGIIGWWFGGS